VIGRLGADGLPSTPGPAPAPSLARWVALCAAAEAVGMTAAAAAAKLSQALVGEPDGTREVVTVLAVVVAGGLVEGTALGVAQGSGLRAWLPDRTRRVWVAVTVAVAGLGWAGAALPGTLAGGGDDGSKPPWLLVVAGALALGAVMGVVLGAAQAPVLRGHVAHPWRWVAASAAAWPAAMAAIFVGATAPSADWSAPTVVVLGTVTGLVAGALLGVVSGWFLPSLTGRPAHERAVVALLGSPLRRMLGRSLIVLRVTGTVTGVAHVLPVSFALDPDGYVVAPGKPETKRWWRNLRREARVRVLVDGAWHEADAVVVTPRGSAYVAARSTYVRRWPHVDLPNDQPLVRIRLRR
jgi:F420H(2)-dependent quinone reductase